MAFYYIGSLTGRKYYLAQSKNPEVTLRKVKSNFKRGLYKDHKLLGGLQQDFIDYGPDDIFMGSYASGVKEPEVKMEIEKTHRAVGITDLRDLDKEIPQRYHRILRKTIELLDQGIISEEEYEHFIDQAE